MLQDVLAEIRSLRLYMEDVNTHIFEQMDAFEAEMRRKMSSLEDEVRTKRKDERQKVTGLIQMSYIIV